MDLNELLDIGQKERDRAKQIRLNCCTAAGCLSSQSDAVKAGLETAVRDAGLEATVEVYRLPTIGDRNHPFFMRQMPIVLENSGKINPERIEAYIAVGGYQQLYNALYEKKVAEVVEEITRSGLRGRGGGGYPTGLKWATVAKMPKEQKYVICNADEGDPGAFMDRSVLESDPHRVLEGMAIAGYAIGANQGYIYVRAEYPLAIAHLEKAIKQAKRLGLLGTQIFDSAFDFRIDIRVGAGAFVCGEETALIASVEGAPSLSSRVGVVGLSHPD
jgi:bidirectional [NiFe] hydrogenase diaphorase subunit